MPVHETGLEFGDIDPEVGFDACRKIDNPHSKLTVTKSVTKIQRLELMIGLPLCKNRFPRSLWFPREGKFAFELRASCYFSPSTFIAALWPGIPLTAPPRSALEPQRKTFSHSVSTPQVPTCSFFVANGQVGESWKILP